MLSLIVRVPGEPVRRVRLDRPVVTLGRASTNDVPLADRTLSRVHARIEDGPGGPMLVDLGSRNGTALNGVRLEAPSHLQPGDRIRLGETLVDVSSDSETRVVIDSADRQVESTLLRSSADLIRSQREVAAAQSREELQRLATSLRILNEVTTELLTDHPTSDILKLILERVFTYLEPDRGILMLANERGELRPEAVKFAQGVDPSDIRLSQTLVQAVMERRNGVLFVDARADERLAAAESILMHGITSCMAAPLCVAEKVMGLIYLEARLGRKSFGEEDLRLLTSLANTAAIKLHNTRLQEAAAAQQRIEREMALAWEIQQRLLPERSPTIPGLELQGRTIPSRTVSGDYWDYFERADQTLDVVVADVCGKGMGASILAASVQAAFQAWASEGFSPDRLCTRLNDLLYRRTSPEKFVTFFVAQLDPESGALLYTNAGHNPAILVDANGRSQKLSAHGPPLGLLPGLKYASGAVTLAPGDLLMLYTDGLTEAARADDEEFGIDRLERLAVELRARPLAEIEEHVSDSIAAFVGGVPDADDRTLVLVRRTPCPTTDPT